MTCKIGITTDPERRRARWEHWCIKQGHPMKNWEIIDKFSTKEEAQKAEDALATELGCEAYPGGPDVDGPWHLYRIDY